MRLSTDLAPLAWRMSPFSLYARAFLAYCIHEHQEGFVRRIDVWLQPRSFTAQDDGRGMGLHREGYVTNLMGTLCGGPGAIQLHGIGLSIVAASSPSLAIEARRDGKLWRQSFAWGIADGPPRSEPAGPDTGTRITVALPAEAADIDAADVIAQVEVWRKMYAGLTIVVH